MRHRPAAYHSAVRSLKLMRLGSLAEALLPIPEECRYGGSRDPALSWHSGGALVVAVNFCGSRVADRADSYRPYGKIGFARCRQTVHDTPTLASERKPRPRWPFGGVLLFLEAVAVKTLRPPQREAPPKRGHSPGGGCETCLLLKRHSKCIGSQVREPEA
jgi:hypothetical protein